jgi:preprotein translocase subunit SecE
VARNRKRRSDRRSERPPDGDSTPPGIATARASLDEAPDPIEHATPDVELAEAQLALGRPELAAAGEGRFADEDDAEYAGEDLDGDDGGSDIPGGPGGAAPHGGLSPAAPSAGAPALRPGGRLVGFLQGSWRELQRVQWPDRRQVMQATGVVIGFVIVAGVFLGVADLIAGKVVNLIIK